MVTTRKQSEMLGYMLAGLASPGDILVLEGELGAGKTTLTKAVAAGLGVRDRYVTSPSFAVLHEYRGRIPLYHFDFYRLGSGEEVEEQGFSEYFYKEGLCVIEWAGIAEEYLPQQRAEITIQHNGEEEEFRDITIRGSFSVNNFTALLQQELGACGILVR